MIKLLNTVEPGEIFRTEYGDFDNFVNLVFESAEPYLNGTKINCHYVNSKNSLEVYDLSPPDKVYLSVIGKEQTDES